MSGLLSTFTDHILPILLTASAGLLAHKLLGPSQRPPAQIAFFVLSLELVSRPLDLLGASSAPALE